MGVDKFEPGRRMGLQPTAGWRRSELMAREYDASATGCPGPSGVGVRLEVAVIYQRSVPE